MRSLVSLCVFAAALPALAQEKLDLAAVHRIKAEAFSNSQVMDHLFWLTDANGPRLTNSPGYRKAADWAVKTLQGWGASKPHLEKWGTFGRGWSLTHLSASLVAPVYAPLEVAPKAWCAGTSGPVTAELVVAPLFLKADKDWLDLAKTAARIAKYGAEQKGKLKGKIVLISEVHDLDLPKESVGSRYDDTKLGTLVTTDPLPPQPWEWPLQRLPDDDRKMAALREYLPVEVMADYWERRRHLLATAMDFFRAEGAVALLSTDERGEGGLVFAEGTGVWELGSQPTLPWLVLDPEDYNRLARLTEKKVPARVQLDVGVAFLDDAPDGFNVVAELPGGKKANEVVMLGAHLDSWAAGTGATDNGSGSAVALEAFRILKALKLPLDRTVRLALWSGEEQGLYGSRGYVKEHFGDPVTMKLKPEHATLAGYFNVDNGSGKLRGVWLQGNDMVRPIFETWLAPFKDLGATTLSIRNTGGTDHLSFDAVGLPGFQFIQDPLDYGTRTHHSALDLYDHAQPSDLMQASAVLATFVYAAATRPEPLPRKPLPRPLPPKVARP